MGSDKLNSDISLSATVILLRKGFHQPTADQEGVFASLETLMVQRSTQMGFAGGAIVFPGGKIDKADYGMLASLGAGGSESDVHASQHEQQSSVTKIAAIRELFEETGILLASFEGHPLSPAMWRENDLGSLKRRKEINLSAKLFFKFLQDFELEINLDALTGFAQWRTPPNLHRRFDTHFYLAQMPEEQSVLADGEESTEALWASPSEFLEMGKSGERKIIFPTARILELLALDKTYDDILSRTRNRPKRCIEPQVVEENGEHFLTIPDDLGYPVVREQLTQANRG